MKLFRAKITICQGCVDGDGQECHSPGCSLYLHRVDLPIEVDEMVEIGDVENRSREIEFVPWLTEDWQ